ncbi:lipoprotein [Sphaerisporangium rufum]|uniref:Lipoprotein n=1 Tax=Sphaerisporangium rufum TaxID=1381558 RepID=A0A919V1Z9_9ACTN|nr:DUF305 domain-containing protein [Sphaerisporangium rufum]GII81626.1 lipoprotein [Sphaerisporangium rufum]
MIIPGAPGEAGRTAAPGERLGRSPAGPSAADVRFAERMIPHHRQALEMAGLAAGRGAGAGVQAICRRIMAAQRPEVDLMTRWLRALGREAPAGHQGHGAGADGAGADGAAGDGYGMASPAEMARLRAARGAAFDALLLDLMIRHHQGAVRMAAEELAGGTDQTLRTMARDVASGQRVEVDRMRRLRG